MSTSQKQLISPSASAISTPSATQAPTSIKDSLPSHGISLEDAEEWNRDHNYERILRIHEERLWALLIELSKTKPLDDSRVKSAMEQKSTQSREKFDEQVYLVRRGCIELFQNQSQKSAFISAIDEQHTIHGYEDLVADCLPMIIDALQQHKPSPQKRSGTGHTRKKTGGVMKSSSESIERTGIRRSPRLRRFPIDQM